MAVNIMTNKTHILVVDDDAKLRDLLVDFLTQHGYHVKCAADGGEMFRALETFACDLIVLDVMMPGADGLELCRQLRKTSDVPVIMLTAMGDDVDRIIGLEVGADDYMCKPFNPRELLARVKAITRRIGVQSSTKDVKKSDASIYQFGHWRLNTLSRQLLSTDGIEVMLSSGEYRLLLLFLERPNRTLSRDFLLDALSQREAGPYDRSIDIQVSRLRHKIEDNAKQPSYIKTVRGGGYIFAQSVERV